VTALAVGTTAVGTDQTVNAMTARAKLQTHECRKILWISPQVIEKHLREKVVPYCNFNKEQLLE
jgi:hypothetical protein